MNDERETKSTAGRPPRLRPSVIASDDRRRVLLLNHVRPQGSYWVLPGGAMESGETLEEAAAREVMEELGVGCVVGRLVAVGELITPERHVVDLFLQGELEATDGFVVRHDEGIRAAEWVHVARLGEKVILPPEIIPSLQALAAAKQTGVIYLGKYNIGLRNLNIGGGW